MTYDLAEHRRSVHDHLLHLVRDGGPGWDDFARQRARECERDDPALHAGLLKAVNDGIAQRDAERSKPRKGATR